jgi:hypothetical protein
LPTDALWAAVAAEAAAQSRELHHLVEGVLAFWLDWMAWRRQNGE